MATLAVSASSGTVSLHEVVPLLDVVSELESLALHLGLSESAILQVRAIPANVDLATKQIVLVSKWLQSDVQASWSKLAKALFKMNYKKLSSQIRFKYDCEEIMELEGGAVEDPSSDKCVVMVRSNEDKIKGLFSSLLLDLCKSLSSHHVDTGVLRHFLVNFFKCDECIPESQDVGKILDAVSVNGLWSHLHYSPLDALITRFMPSDPTVKDLMKTYKSQLSGFQLTTKLISYIKVKNLQGDADPSTDHKFTLEHYNKIKVVVRLDRKVSEISLLYVEELWSSFSEEFEIPSLTAIVHDIAPGSLEVTWLIPCHWSELIKPKSRFCRWHNILIIAVNDNIIYDERKMVEYEKSFLKLCYEDTADISRFGDLLSLGVHPDIYAKDGYHPLCLISLCGRGDLAELFIDHGAIVDLPTNNKLGATALQAASKGGHLKVISILLRRGAFINFVNRNGATPLKYAADGGHIKAVHVLLDSGAMINKGIVKPLWAASYEGKVEVVGVLIDRGAEVNLPNESEIGEVPLHAASKQGHVNVMTVLIQRGAKVDYLNKNGETPLVYAAKGGHIKAVHVLLDSGAMINKGITKPLWEASYGGRLEVVEVLIDRGAEVNLPIEDEYGETPLVTACAHGHVDVASLLIRNGASVNFQSKMGWTPLLAASLEGYIEVVKLLLQHQVQVEVENKEGRTALLAASWKGHVHIVCALLEAGARPDAQDKEGLTALMLATQNSHTDVIAALVDAKADPSIVEKSSGWSPLFFAAKAGNLKIVKQLVAGGAAVDIKDTNGATAYDVAKLSGHQAVCDELENYINQETKTEINEDQKEQVTASSKQFTSIFDFLEKTLLRGRVEKRKKLLKEQEKSIKGTSSNLLESRQT